MHGFKVENRGLNHARINSESGKLTLGKKKKNKTDSFLCNQLAGYDTKEEVECSGGGGGGIPPPVHLFLALTPMVTF